MMRAVVAVLVALLAVTARAQQCGLQAGGKLCPGGLCCSKDGYCGSTDPWCGDGCQSQCSGGGGGGDDCGGGGGGGGEEEEDDEGGDGVASVISRSLFEEMLKHRNDVNCPGRCFYTYDAFINATKFFPGFGTTGDLETRKRELAAFLGQTSHETNGGWATAPDGPYAWGYCFKEEVNGPAGPDYCQASSQWPCVPGKKYYGRGPIQLSWNYNYGQAGEAKEIAADLLHDPDLVAHDPFVSFKTAIWFWMTPQAPKPSCHDVMTGQWVPSPNDLAANRLPGYGVTTNIINGGIECGNRGHEDAVENRIGYYKRYCDMLGVTYGYNLDCYDQRNFAVTSAPASSYHADA